MEVEMKIRGLMMDPVTNMPIVVLKDAQGTAVFTFTGLGFPSYVVSYRIEELAHPEIEGVAIGIAHEIITNVGELAENFA